MNPSIYPMTEEKDFREVSVDEFFAGIAKQNVHPRIVGNWPYTSLYETLDGARRVIGKSVEFLNPGKAITQTRYWLLLTRRLDQEEQQP
jgi:hypothetical protein